MHLLACVWLDIVAAVLQNRDLCRESGTYIHDSYPALPAKPSSFSFSELPQAVIFTFSKVGGPDDDKREIAVAWIGSAVWVLLNVTVLPLFVIWGDRNCRRTFSFYYDKGAGYLGSLKDNLNPEEIQSLTTHVTTALRATCNLSSRAKIFVEYHARSELVDIYMNPANVPHAFAVVRIKPANDLNKVINALFDPIRMNNEEYVAKMHQIFAESGVYNFFDHIAKDQIGFELADLAWVDRLLQKRTNDSTEAGSLAGAALTHPSGSPIEAWAK